MSAWKFILIYGEKRRLTPWLDNFCPDILRGCRVSWNWYKLVSRLKWFYSGPPNWSHLAHYRRLTRVLCKCFSSVLRIASSLESNVSIERQFVYTDTLARVVQFLFFCNESIRGERFVCEWNEAEDNRYLYYPMHFRIKLFHEFEFEGFKEENCFEIFSPIGSNLISDRLREWNTPGPCVSLFH